MSGGRNRLGGFRACTRDCEDRGHRPCRCGRAKARRPALGEVVGEPLLTGHIYASAAEALATPCDVFVEYTKPDTARTNVLTALEHGAHVVVGTSGLTDSDFAQIDVLARKQHRGVLACGNFALTVVLRACVSPVQSAQPRATTVPLASTVGPRETRGATVSGSQVHSIRLPGYVISAEIIFGMPDQKLTIRHDSGNSARPYVDGALLAIRKVSTLVGVHRGLDSVLDL